MAATGGASVVASGDLGAALSAGAARGIRTPDPIITNDVLYQLSYCGIPRYFNGLLDSTPENKAGWLLASNFIAQP
jgi:hypothetical protein